MKKKRLHILGIAGTFMAGIATLAKELGYEVTGSDQHCYPPMSDYLESLGIEVFEGFESLESLAILDEVDEIIIGNVMRRGMPVIEKMLDEKRELISGPAWLEEKVLRNRWVLCVTGTHGKTTTSSLLAWILEFNGLKPGFLIGGIPSNFGVSAKLGEDPFFVIEGDEYDTGFFDKRSKFLHCRPNSLIINNLEFDHADIFDDLKMIQRQFHHVLKILPSHGRVIYPKGIKSIEEVLSWGVFSEQDTVGLEGRWQARFKPEVKSGSGVGLGSDGSSFEVWCEEKLVGKVNWDLLGQHNVNNALTAIAAAHHAGLKPEDAIQALANFKGVKRRMELKGNVGDVSVYDDFAHHPTAIETTLAGLKAHVKNSKKTKKTKNTGRVLAVFEPRSNTLKSGHGKEELAKSFGLADEVYIFQSLAVKWDVKNIFKEVGIEAKIFLETELLIQALVKNSQPGDHILIMSNGGFENIHARLLKALAPLVTA